jgi:hypothetical protein
MASATLKISLPALLLLGVGICKRVRFGQQKERTGSQAVSQLMSSLRTMVINLLRRKGVKNMAAQLEDFADKFQTFL